jgi:predicted RNA-binding Zn-ribbon protein involved in translation (DUF1610 family)
VQSNHYARTPTLGSAARRQSLLRTWCNSCRRIVDIDPGEQAARYGEDLPVPEWRTHLVCPQCGSRVIDSVVGPVRLGAPVAAS